MRLFKSNKSQASIDRLTSSRSSSPDPYGTGVAGSQAGGAPQFQGQGGFPERFNPPPQSQSQPVDPAQYQDSQVHSHPAHVISRSSAEAPGYGDGGRRPSGPITVVPPISPGNIPPQVQGPGVVPGQTQFGQSKQVHVHTEKEHKRSKRSIFGLSSSKEKDKENSPVEKEKKGVGRSGSIHLLRKHHPGQQSVDSQQQPQSPQYLRHSAYFARTDVSREDLPEDPSHYEQYRNQTEGQYDSPSSQYARHSPEQPEDPHFSPQREQYQAYHQGDHPDTSDQYVAYQGAQQGRPVGIILDQYQSLRPPSQSSLGPPSPIISHQPDSRPSTAATSRYSSQSVGQPQQQQVQQLQPSHQQMARGDPPNGGMRQQMRDPRGDDHGQYQQDPRVRMSQQIDQGRNSPQPRNRGDTGDMDYASLLTKHEELQAKYSKVKRYYFEREAQVTQLQNTVANQRLSMSKTSLDDAQYSSRFERLSGAINNLSFNIRKDWKNVPPWLRPVCNQEAHSVGTKEMTAVGRACITRWLYETVFQQVFHPGIEHSVSRNLKHIEQNLRRQGQSAIIYTDEQRDDLLTKITTWRLTTIEGLQDQLNSKFAQQYQENLVGSLTVDLTNSLKANLNDPPPPGLQESVTTIIGQAVSICANIPMESRDVCIEYFMPGEQINETYMKVETGMTALTNPGLDERVTALGGSTQGSPDSDDDDEDRERDVEAEIREATKAAQSAGAAGAGGNGSVNSMPTSASQSTMKSGEKQRDGSRGAGKEQKSSFLGAFVGKKPPPSQSRQGSQHQRERTEDRGGSQSESASVRASQRGESGDNVAEERSVMSASGTMERERERQREENVQVMPPLVPGEGKIRFAVFLAVEVRGKMLKEQQSSAPAEAGSAGVGAQGSGSSAGGGGSGGKGNINVLVKAPVYEL